MITIDAEMTMKPRRSRRAKLPDEKLVFTLTAAPLTNSSPVLSVIVADVDLKSPKTTPERRAKATAKKAKQRRRGKDNTTVTAAHTLPRDDLDKAIFNFVMSGEKPEDPHEVRHAIRTIKANDFEVDQKSKAAILAFWFEESIRRWVKQRCPPVEGQDRFR